MARWGGVEKKGEMDSSVLALIATVLSLVSLVVSGLHCAMRRNSKGVDISARFDGSSEPPPASGGP